MQRSIALFTAGLAALGVAAAARAGTAGFAGTLTISLHSLPDIPIRGTGVATLNGMLGGSHITTLRFAEGVFQGSSVLPVTDPDSVQIQAVAITVTNEAGSLGGPASGGSPSDPITKSRLGPAGGLGRICLYSVACGLNLAVALTRSHTSGTSSIGFGVGGQQTMGGSGTLRVSIDHAPWTIHAGTAIDQPDDSAQGSVSFGGVASGAHTTATGSATGNFRVVSGHGFGHGPGSSSSTTALTSGVIQFVTPGQVSTNITSTSSLRIALVSSLRFHMIPEPGLLLLLGSGVAGLVVLGRRRRDP